MGRARSNSRTDAQLEAILTEPGNWVVNGYQGRALHFAPNLGRALDLAADYTAEGAVVSSLARLPSDNIVVFAEQIERLRTLVGEREFGRAGVMGYGHEAHNDFAAGAIAAK
jgi:hypothetical protein